MKFQKYNKINEKCKACFQFELCLLVTMSTNQLLFKSVAILIFLIQVRNGKRFLLTNIIVKIILGVESSRAAKRTTNAAWTVGDVNWKIYANDFRSLEATNWTGLKCNCK